MDVFKETIPTPKRGGPEFNDRFDRMVDRIPDPPSAGGGDIQFPFQILDKSDDTDTQAWVRFGTVMDVEPTGCETNIVFTSDDVYTIYVNVTVDINGVQTAVEIDNGTGGQPADSDYNGYLTLGVVTVDGGKITLIQQAATHSLRFAMCGRVVSSSTLITAGTFEFWGF